MPKERSLLSFIPLPLRALLMGRSVVVADDRRPRSLGRTIEELRRLFDEVADANWRSPEWGGALAFLAASETFGRRSWSAEGSVEAFVEALGANSGPTADTFMAVPQAPAPTSLDARVRRAVARGRVVSQTLTELEHHTQDQPLWTTLCLDGGWLRPEALAWSSRRSARSTPIAFLVGDTVRLIDLAEGITDQDLTRLLRDAALGRRCALAEVDARASAPTPAAAVIAVDPIELEAARSFHRRAWTRGGGPWMGVADCPSYGVVSTCHVAVDGYMHAKITDRVLGQREPQEPQEPHRLRSTSSAAPTTSGGAAPVGFATCEIPSAPRFAAAVHAFGVVLDRHLGADGSSVSVPFQIPIAPGLPTDDSRWRRRPLYGLLALSKRQGRLESRADLAARLPEWIAREATGSGLLSRALRATLELPVPKALRRRVISERRWSDRWAPARVLTGGGYLSWMRFEAGDEPSQPLHPSAIPSFADDRGGAGLSIIHRASGLSVGLTTSGALGTAAAAERFLSEWVDQLGAEAR